MTSVKRKKILFSLFMYVILGLGVIVFCFPIFMLVSRSLMTTMEATLVPARFWPEIPQWKNYLDIFNAVGNFNGVSYWLLWFKNTVILEVAVIAGTVFSSAWVAYGFTRIRFPGRGLVFAIVLATMMIPSTVTMIPLYAIFSDLHWLNTLHPLIWPMWCGGGAVNIFLVVQYMRTLPKEFNESAQIDGANDFLIFFKIILPASIPIMTAVGVGAFVGIWNDLVNPLMYLNTKEMWTLALGMTTLNTNSAEVGGVPFVFAACVIFSLPPILLFTGAQKYFIESIVMTGIKG